MQKKHPELVEKSFTLKWSEVNKEKLQTKVGVKATWQWQLQDDNWQKLASQYPEMQQVAAETVEERLTQLDNLDPAKRQMVDTFSRKEIIKEHPEWILEALQESSPHEETVLLRQEKGPMPFKGITDQKTFVALLENAPVNEVADALSSYTQDNVHFYQIEVVDRAPDYSVVSFKAAKDDKTLNALHAAEHKHLENYFEKYFAKLKADAEAMQKQYPQAAHFDDENEALLAAYFLPYMLEIRQKIQESPENAQEWVAFDDEDDTQKLIHSEHQIVRKDTDTAVDKENVFSQEPQVISPIRTNASSGLHFYRVTDNGFLSGFEMMREKILAQRELLGNAAMAKLGSFLVDEMVRKNATTMIPNEVVVEAEAS